MPGLTTSSSSEDSGDRDLRLEDRRVGLRTAEQGRGWQRTLAGLPRRRVLILVFAVALVAAAWLRRPATALTIAPLDASAPSFTHAFAVGRRLVYEVDYRTEALVDGNLQRGPKGEGAPRADNLLTLSSVIGGKLTLTVVERRGDDSARVLATLTELVVDVVVTGRALALPEETFAPLARGFFVDYGPVGDVRGIAVEADTHPIAGRLASQVLAFLQLEAPPGHGDAWEMDEKDPLGELHARYSVLADKPSHDAGQLIQKLVARRGVPRTSGALARLVASGGTLGTSTLAYEVSPARGTLDRPCT